MVERNPSKLVVDQRALDVEEIEKAVARGIQLAMSDPKLWEAAGSAMRAHAHATAGGWLIGGAVTLSKRLAWAVTILAGIYFLGGWSAVVAFVKTQGGHS
jgi:hypothetical protein